MGYRLVVYDGLVVLAWGFIAVTGLFLFKFIDPVLSVQFVSSIVIGVLVGVILFAYLTMKMFKELKTNGAFTPPFLYVIVLFLVLIALVAIARISEMSFLITMTYGFSSIIPAGFLTRLVACLMWERNNAKKILATSELPMKISARSS